MAFHALGAFSNTLTGTWPTTTVGDFLIACVSIDEAPTTLASTGWTSIGTAQTNTFDGQTSQIFYYSGNGGAGAPLVPPTTSAWTSSGGAGSPTVVIASYTGNAIGAPASTPKIMSTGQTTPFTAAMTGVTAAAGADLICFFCADQTNSNILSMACTGTPGTFTNRGSGGDGFSQVAISTVDAIAAGATGTISGAITSAGGNITIGWVSFVVAIPQAGGAPTIYNALFMGSD